MEYLNGTYPITDSSGVRYNCEVRAQGSYGVQTAACCDCDAVDPLSATRDRMYRTGSSYVCYYSCIPCHPFPSPPPPSPPPPLPALPPPTPAPVYNDSCYFLPRVNFTWTGAPLQGISSAKGFAEAEHLCLERTDCHAIVENAFENNLEPQKRYVLRGEGGLQAEAGTTTLVRDRNHCTPSPPPSPSSPPFPPPNFPVLQMQTRPLYIVSFQATVQTTVEAFDVSAYSRRMSTALNTPEVGVTVTSGSVVVTTTAGADDQAGANQLVSELTDMSNNTDLLSNLYGAPAEVDTNSISIAQNPDAIVAPPPSTPPPERSEEDHSYIALIIILAILVPTAAFFVYLRFDQIEAKKKKKKKKLQLPKEQRKAYATITTTEFAPTNHSSELSFKFHI